ncbi:MAG: hypothetical protein C3F11_08610 [Methylocystaceae bacterium]|nr:MAG: hypothetical protein C3F11_08610 [Methylocystaceae bacterium]
MKKPALFLLALGSGFALAGGAPSALDRSLPADQPATQERSEDLPSPQALCKQVEVKLDEGYGVSGRETRVVCDQNQ